MRRASRRLITIAGLSLLAFVATSTAPAGATGAVYFDPPSKYSVQDEFLDCDDQVNIALSVKGINAVKNVPGSNGQAFLAIDTYRYSETWTDPETGAFILSIKGAYDFRETSAKLVPNDQVPAELIPEGGLIGPVYEFRSRDVGTDVVKLANGETYWSAGVLQYRQLFDTLGDGQPGGVNLDFQITDVKGKFPLLDADLCEVALNQ